MIKKIVIGLAVFAGFGANASLFVNVVDVNQLQQVAQEQVEAQSILPWKVGDKADYKINLGGFLDGSMKMFVREEVTEGFWVQQDVDMMIQKSKIEMLFDKNTAKLLQLIVDGQKQDTSQGGETELVESKPATVTVPAGTFECTYLKILDKKQNQTSEMWVEIETIPVFGLIKQLGQSQIGPVTIELTSFLKQ